MNDTTEPDTRRPRQVRFRHLVAGMAATALLASGVTAYASDSFSDVPDSNAFHDEIGWMSDTGISTGYADGTYRPTEPVTRQAMSAFMQRLYRLQAGTTNVTVRADSGGAVTAPVTDPFNSEWVNVTDLQTDVVVPPGTSARLVATLSSEGVCNGGKNQFLLVLAVAPTCKVRLNYVRISGGLSIVAPMSPDEFAVLSSELTPDQMTSNDPDVLVQNDSFSIMAASPGVVGSGTWRVIPQIMADSGGNRPLSFELNASTMKVEAILQDPPD